VNDFAVPVLLVEDDSMVRSWVHFALEESEFRVKGEASSAEEALQLLEQVEPLLLLVDYRLPDKVGTELVRDIRLLGLSTPAILMTANPERGFNEAARDAGAQGTVLKSGKADELLAALRSTLRGESSFDTRHPRRDSGETALSPREREVLRLVAEGATNREIAEALEVGSETVKTLVARTFLKLGVRRRAEAVSVAHGRGLL
jgi:DNA-binding NarL/FixJ family response regulator